MLKAKLDSFIQFKCVIYQIIASATFNSLGDESAMTEEWVGDTS